jgi:hypothetical protein
MRRLSSQGVNAGEARKRAIAYARARGDELVRTAAAVLADDAPPARVAAALADRQRPDGGFDRLPGAAAGEIGRACRALSLLDDVRALRGPVVERIVRHAATLRCAGGGFEDEACRREEDRLVATGMLVGFLARARCARESLLLEASDWLAARFAPERVQGFAWPMIAAYAHAFASFPHDEADGVLQWCGRELERGFRARAWEALRTVRLLAWCGAPVFPGARLGRGELLAALVAEQHEDGGFGAPDAEPAERAARALDAAVGLALLGPARAGAVAAASPGAPPC